MKNIQIFHLAKIFHLALKISKIRLTEEFISNKDIAMFIGLNRNGKYLSTELNLHKIKLLTDARPLII